MTIHGFSFSIAYSPTHFNNIHFAPGKKSPLSFEDFKASGFVPLSDKLLGGIGLFRSNVCVYLYNNKPMLMAKCNLLAQDRNRNESPNLVFSGFLPSESDELNLLVKATSSGTKADSFYSD
jgi:hypothetical protein